jgi:hypothetical protein
LISVIKAFCLVKQNCDICICNSCEMLKGQQTWRICELSENGVGC